MWVVATVVGLVGLALNLFMAVTWVIAGRKHFKKMQFQIKFMVIAGIVYGLVETLPSLILKYDLPCACEDEDWAATEEWCE